ncbi:MAG: PLP-dependent aminotransferase family protein [Vicinamibacteria bacterium]|nr:PLP-dependent aminotransferase family protein [Vicinamibacteria bacterium]
MSFEAQSFLSSVAHRLRASEIRELLKLLDHPEMISFAGGLPNPAAFPRDAIQEVVGHVMTSHAAEALQYGPTEGHHRLRRAIAGGMGARYGAPQEVDNILITTGSQQALSLLAQIVLDPGDSVFTANPTYLGALLTFNAASSRVEGIACDEQGLIPEALERRIDELAAAGARAKLLYLVPTFDNPTGVTMPEDRRRRVYEIACERELLIAEDDPYGLLRYDGKNVPLLKSIDTEGRVAYLGTFSKILAPGFRVGWLAADPLLIRKAVLAKQAQDLCTTTFSQYCIFEIIHDNALFPHIERIKSIYRAKRDLMLRAAERMLPREVRFSRPEGGLFLWVELPPELDALALLPKAMDRGVAYVIGRPFFTDDSGRNTFRMNFSYASDDRIEEGVRRLAEVIAAALEDSRAIERPDRIGIF